MSIRRARIKILAGVIKQPHRQRAISQARGDTPYRSLTMAKTNFDDPRYAATFEGRCDALEIERPGAVPQRGR